MDGHLKHCTLEANLIKSSASLLLYNKFNFITYRAML
jgi:hypothetical protein